AEVFHPDGTVSATAFQPDPRWGALAPYLKTLSLATPGGRRLSVTVERKANLAQPNNPLTLRSLAETITINSRRYTSVFDPGDRQSIRETPGGRRVITESDRYGRVVRQEIVGLLPITFEYDAKGRLTQVSQGAEDYARTATLNYDGEGRITAATDPLKRTTRFEYERAGRITKQIFADGREILFAYDGNGNVISVTPPGKTAHAFDYTPLDQSRSYLPPAVGSQNHSTAYVYNRDKQLIRVTRPDGKNIEVEYDKAGRVSSIAAPQGKTRYLFDAKTDQLKTITAADGSTLSYAYDGFLFASLNWNGAVKGSVARAHDDDLRISSITVNGKRVIENRYDADGMLIQAGALTLERLQRSGLITGTKVGNVKTLDEYNSFAEISRFTASFGDREILAIDYERDGAGRIVKKIETIEGRSRTVAYAYDLAGRLTRVLTDGAQETRYEYDANGNRIAYRGTTGDAKGSYDAQDRLLNYGAVSHRYTANGELVNKGTGGKNTAFDYDAFGSLRSATIAGGSKIEYVIDGVNRRIGKKLEGKLVQGFLYGDALKPVAELDARNNVVSTFSYATRINVPDYLEKSDGIYRVITDHLGSPRLVVNVQTGAIAQRMDYDEFGNVVQDTNPGFQPFGFAGGLYDQHTKLTRFGARDYDASVGRWTTKDPLRFRAGAMNFYQYASKDPVNFVDPSGLDEETGILDRLIGAGDAASQVVRDGNVYHWSEGGHAGNRSQGMQYRADGFVISPNSNGGRFDASGGVSGPVGPGTGSLNFTAEGTFGPDGSTARFGGRGEYNLPLGWGFDFRGEAWGNSDSSGEGRWGGGASTGWGRGKWACRVGVGVGGNFSGDVTVAPTIELPF
ncbi:MAG: RHS repeat domain-containing protein, partial [Candidatus Binatia bacterium]